MSTLPSPRLFTRRQVLQTTACGFGALAFNGLFANPSPEKDPLAPKQPHHTPRAKRVIFLFMSGGPSQVDTFDYKPALDKLHNQKVAGKEGSVYYQGPWKFSPHGECGLMVSELFPHVAKHADDLCVINSMCTDHNAHPQAVLQMHTGSFTFARPSVGAWAVYGLGSENRDLPGFITISPGFASGGALKHASGFLPAACAGMQIGEGGNNGAPPSSLKGIQLPFMKNSRIDSAGQRRQLDLLQALNDERLALDGVNEALEGMTRSAELAFRMQAKLPPLLDVAGESAATLEQYGIGDGKPTDHFGRACLMARHFVESGVRFVQVNHDPWDHHVDIFKGHPKGALETDQPIAALLADLKQRGLLNDTLVLWGGEFGRPPLLNKNKGRDHNNAGFTMWMAGGGVKPGLRYGSTDETGAKVAENKVHLHDLHATLLHLIGLDHERLTFNYSGRDFRLTDVHGEVVTGILA
mgnify:CR=1 FL=1